MTSGLPGERAFLVEIFLPVQDKAGKAQPSELFGAVSQTLTAAFGGVTTYSRAPAEGRWYNWRKIESDDIVVFEAIMPELDAGWWADYRRRLEQQFRQEKILIRATEIRLL